MTGWIAPMLIGAQQPAFDDPDFIYELKLDGIRCIASMCDGKLQLYNKRGQRLLQRFPELDDAGAQIKTDCILDGELYVFKDGVTDFTEIQKRMMLSDPFRIKLAAGKHPAVFTAFDILCVEDEQLMRRPLMERKQILSEMIMENTRINVSRFVEGYGISLFSLTEETKLEGIVAKRRTSLYHPGRRTKEWIKCKNLLDDDFVITGMIPKDNGACSLILAQYDQGSLIYRGHVTLGVSSAMLSGQTSTRGRCPFHPLPAGNEHALWFDPFLVGTVRFMHFMTGGGLRQPVFKGFREDKRPEECVVKERE